MGINPTQANFKSFTFDGENSRNYGVYITGQGVFNAPKRNVEMVEIPGRNGAYALDKGTFNNIEVTYPAGIFADTETDFAEAVSDLRNFLCSRVGYVRLEDDYNPNEYRLAIYKSGLDVDHDLLIAGEFDLVFECKPQRFLKSGETAISVTSGDTITNPTLFDAKPQLQVWGYGNIGIGSQTINIDDVVMGNILLADSSNSPVINLDMSNMMNGDQFTVSGVVDDITYDGDTGYSANLTSIGTQTNCTATNGYSNEIKIYPNDITFAKGTSSSFNWSVVVPIRVYERKGSYDQTTTTTFSGSVSYNGDSTLTFSRTISPSSLTHIRKIIKTRTIPAIYGYSTKSILGNPLYIDLDIGEAYNTDSGTLVSVNDAVSMPAELPVLPSGATTIMYDNTVTQFKIVPRWWKV